MGQSYRVREAWQTSSSAPIPAVRATMTEPLESPKTVVYRAAKQSADMMTIMVPDLLEPTEEIRGLCAFVVRDLHEGRSLLLAMRQ